ncbi:PG0541 family transporter-associated protein [Spirochaeta africana]|uniref:Nitrogen regulatory protein PII n=1 Tax=Spirochaeta africana (strain ATCC 700263 / DSM 8902 / Z-7692) TaxID=889378 RepID=H9UMX4_SPIAZ|nr:PG0541 family transporter-associated protein [Spirochaeta africana]AFG38867.1 hypothetical protein Spiaf_2843 [Spirochaeta africana DSM 8902]
MQQRIEIILNQAVEEDLFDRFQAHNVGTRYTKIAPAFGKGRSGERHGDHIWPEENLVLIMYCSTEEGERIIQAAREVKQLFPNEGIKLYTMPAENIQL